MTTDNTARIAPTSRLTVTATASPDFRAASRRLRGPDRLILSWLTTQLASYLEVPTTAVSPTVPLAEMGVDSVHAISLVGDVEAHFEIDVDPTMIFDYPTLSHLAEYIDTAVTEREEAVA
jgi:acyl carrier protein